MAGNSNRCVNSNDTAFEETGCRGLGLSGEPEWPLSQSCVSPLMAIDVPHSTDNEVGLAQDVCSTLKFQIAAPNLNDPLDSTSAQKRMKLGELPGLASRFPANRVRYSRHCRSSEPSGQSRLPSQTLCCGMHSLEPPPQRNPPAHTPVR